MLAADAMGFLTWQGQGFQPDPNLAKHVSLMHVTACHPHITTTDEQVEALVVCRDRISNYDGLPGAASLRLINSQSDMLDIRVGKETGIVLGLQNAPYDSSLNNLERLFAQGVRILSLCYDGPHPSVVDHGTKTGHLTKAGEQFIRDMEQVEMILDLSHATATTAQHVLDFIEKNDLGNVVIASHGGVSDVYNVPRNLPLSVLDRILARKTGFVGLSTVTFDLDPEENGLEPFLAHLNKLTRWRVGLGSDAIYRELDLEEWKAWFLKMQAKLDPDGKRGSRWPDFPLELNGVDRIDRLKEKLREQSHDAELIMSFLGGSFQRMLLRSLPVS